MTLSRALGAKRLVPEEVKVMAYVSILYSAWLIEETQKNEEAEEFRSDHAVCQELRRRVKEAGTKESQSFISYTVSA